MRQSDCNPYPYSDSNKRYYTYDYWLRQTFGGKCVKIPLNAGFTCPNIDGRCGVGGCIYCSGRGSGDFTESALLPLEEQYRLTREKLAKKWQVSRCIPYFQAYTNTYAPLDVLQEKFEAALRLDGAVGLNIATRADCLPDNVCTYLGELAERTVLTVELGLQSSSDVTAERIHRGYTFSDFCTGYRKLREMSDKIHICVHIIFGLPGETRTDMRNTVLEIARIHPDQVKIHLLHVLRGTQLGTMFEKGEYVPMERAEYIDTVVEALQILPSDIVIGRLTGDGMADELLAPDWSRNKVTVLNDIDKRLFAENVWQGKNFTGNLAKRDGM